MGNKGCTLVVQTEETNYSAGDLVNGRIYLSVNEASIDCTALNVHFCGEEYAKVHYTSHNSSNDHRSNRQDHYETHRETILDENYTIHSFANGKIPRGHYEFPFQMQIPNNLPSSMYCRKDESCCAVKYTLCAAIQGSQISGNWNPFQNTALSSKPIVLGIYNNPNSSIGSNGNGNGGKIGNKTLYFPSKTQRINYWCCINRGFMDVDAQLGKNVTSEESNHPSAQIFVDAYTGMANLTPDAEYLVPIRVSNQSTTSVKSLRMELIEIVRWKPRHREETNKDSIVRQSVNRGAVDQWKGRASRRHHCNSSETMEFAGRNISGNFTSGASDQQVFVFSIPSSTRDTYQGRMIEVEHFLQIKAITKCCMTDPMTEMRINITRPLCNSPVPYEGDESMAMPLDHTVSPSAPPMDAEAVFAQAATLPDDWSPYTADMVSLPVASVVGILEEGLEGASPLTIAWVEGSSDGSNFGMPIAQIH